MTLYFYKEWVRREKKLPIDDIIDLTLKTIKMVSIPKKRPYNEYQVYSYLEIDYRNNTNATHRQFLQRKLANATTVYN